MPYVIFAHKYVIRLWNKIHACLCKLRLCWCVVCSIITNRIHIYTTCKIIKKGKFKSWINPKVFWQIFCYSCKCGKIKRKSCKYKLFSLFVTMLSFCGVVSWCHGRLWYYTDHCNQSGAAVHRSMQLSWSAFIFYVFLKDLVVHVFWKYLKMHTIMVECTWSV